MQADGPSHGSAPTGAPARIILLSDFGTVDGYPAAMRGVISTIAPGAVVADATHEIASGDVAAAAYVLARYARFHPPGTIHVAVVDPGVGSTRRALAARIDDQFYVAPDNGLLTRVLQHASSSRVVTIEAEAYRQRDVSATFHGRDIFAPAAAWLARGLPLDRLGAPIDDPVLLDLLQPQRIGDHVQGVVEYIDRFGNLITNIPAAWLDGSARVTIRGRDVGPLCTTYSDAMPGSPLALTGSDGMLEIAVRDGSAAAFLGVERNAAVDVRAVPRGNIIFATENTEDTG